MQNTCPNPTCGAMYNLTPQHVGRSFACKKCGSTLVVSAAGLELAGTQPVGTEPGVQPAGEDPSPMRSRPSSGPGAGVVFAQFWERIKSDLPTWLIGTSAVIMLICLFFPVLDQDKVDRREAKRSAARRDYERRIRELDSKAKKPKLSNEERTKLEEDKKDADDRWKDIDEPKLKDEVEEAKESAKSWKYWYDWGMMWACMLLAFGALGYLAPQQSPVRRVIACILLSALLLLVLMRFIGRVSISAGIG